MRLVPAVIAAAALSSSACVATVGPRFSPDVATALARDQMRRMETDRLVVYYPGHARETALAVSARLEACARALFDRAVSRTERGKVVVIITSAEFNNAFVRARFAGSPVEMVLPLQMGVEVFNFFDLGVTNVGDVACHEAVHYAHLEQIDGFWRYVNLVFGDLVAPNLSTEAWFIEGLATWLEGNLGSHSGRPHSPLWAGMLASGMAGQRGWLAEGQLSPAHRELYPFGGSYLAGSDFVAWLAETYGEEKLWNLVDKQGRSIFFPLGVTLRFNAVYGRTIGQLFDQYSRARAAHLVRRERPPGQEVRLADAGYFARLATAPDGAVALLSVGLDREPHLEVFERDGRRRFSRVMAQVLPGRAWISGHPSSASGLSFTRDGRFLFLFAEDVGIDTASVYELRQFDAADGRFVRSWRGLKGLGGDVTPDGRGYVFARIEEGVANLARLDLQSGAVEALTRFEDRASIGGIAVSPDGQRIAFSRRGPHGFDLHLREPDGATRALTFDGRFNYGARWLSDEELLISREADGRAQAHALHVPTGEVRKLTDVPWALLDASPLPGGRIAFLNREAWRWSVDEAAVAPRAAPAESASAPRAAAPEAAFSPFPEASDDAPPPPVRVLKDERYRGLTELFIPRLRTPLFAVGVADGQLERFTAQLSLLGFDRLGYHGWALTVGYDSDLDVPNVAVGYGNHQLAPWFVSAAASRTGSYFQTAAPEGTDPIDNVANDATVVLAARRPFWTTQLTLGAEGIWRQQEATLPTGESASLSVRLVGPFAAVSWFGGEGTAYAGTRRGLSLEARGAVYPAGLGSDFNLYDARGAVGAWVPMPVPRATFALSVRGRSVWSAPEGGLLRVGGVGDGVLVDVPGSASPQPLPPPDLFLPFSFSEPLRGFEDFGFRANAALIGGARLRYPVIVDWGTTSVLWLFPSFFLRQVELELWGEAAGTDLAPQFHSAAGFTARVRTLWASMAPFTVFYQYAYRFDPGFAPHHIVGIAFE